jgi:hypothetical protein
LRLPEFLAFRYISVTMRSCIAQRHQECSIDHIRIYFREGMMKRSLIPLLMLCLLLTPALTGCNKQENARKALANQGITWNKANFLDSLTREDYTTFKLFLKGGYQGDSDEFARFIGTDGLLKHRSVKLLLKYKTFDPNVVCYATYDNKLKNEKIVATMQKAMTGDPDIRGWLISGLCGTPDGMERLKAAQAKYKSEEGSKSEAVAALKAIIKQIEKKQRQSED